MSWCGVMLRCAYRYSPLWKIWEVWEGERGVVCCVVVCCVVACCVMKCCVVVCCVMEYPGVLCCGVL